MKEEKKEERTPYTLSAEIFAIVQQRPQSVEQITQKIFKNIRYNNQCRVWLCINSMMKHGIFIPVFSNGIILYKFNDKRVDGT